MCRWSLVLGFSVKVWGRERESPKIAPLSIFSLVLAGRGIVLGDHTSTLMTKVTQRYRALSYYYISMHVHLMYEVHWSDLSGSFL